MISKKQYLKALDTVKKYEEQLRIAVVVRSAVKKIKTILLDDVCYSVDIDGQDNKTVNRFEFGEVVNILLTQKQHEDFIRNDTSREFEVSEKRISRMFTYINSDENVWRKQRQYYAQHKAKHTYTMKTTKLTTGITITHSNGIFYQEMKVESEKLKKYDYCNRSIINYKICKK